MAQYYPVLSMHWTFTNSNLMHSVYCYAVTSQLPTSRGCGRLSWRYQRALMVHPPIAGGTRYLFVFSLVLDKVIILIMFCLSLARVWAPSLHEYRPRRSRHLYPAWCKCVINSCMHTRSHTHTCTCAHTTHMHTHTHASKLTHKYTHVLIILYTPQTHVYWWWNTHIHIYAHILVYPYNIYNILYSNLLRYGG